jgi:branched-chain amino acid aminotransferase
MTASPPGVPSQANAAFAAGCAWIDGEYLPIADARIPITDTGFTRSDCTYDVVAVWEGRFFRLDDHLDRFEHSCSALRLRPPLTRTAMREVLFECVRRTGLRSAYVEMIATRGVPPAGERDPRRFVNRWYALAIPYVWIVKPDDQLAGAHLVVAHDVRRIDPSSVDPRVKNFHWGDLVRGLFEAYTRGGTTVVLLNVAGEVTEGPGFNVFAFADGALWTPQAGVLEGITRRTILELAAARGLVTRVVPFGAEVLARAEEMFLTSTAGGVMPVTLLDGKRVGDGRPGPVTLALREAYWAAHVDPRYAQAIEY